MPDLASPTRFTELVQCRKLLDRDPRLPAMSDKVAVKAFVEERLGPKWLIPTLWHGSVLPETPPWPTPFIVKSRHGCNHRAIVRDESADWQAVRRAADRWMSAHYGAWLDEWLYRHVPPGILVEPFLGPAGRLPVDYKLYVFGGRVEFVQVHLDRDGDHRWILLDRQWRRVSRATADADPARPHALPAMIAAAETLGDRFDFVRIDLYEIDRRPLFGEMTFYPGSGLDPFHPDAIDLRMGALWKAIRGSSTAPAIATAEPAIA